MKRRFAGGVHGLLEALAWLQREAATGVLGPGTGESGQLRFRDGLLLEVETPGPSETKTGLDLRERSASLMEDWSFGDALLVFHAGDDPRPASEEAGKLTAGDLILDLVRRSADPRWVIRRLARCTGKISNPAALPRILPRVAMTPVEAFLLSRADGTMTLEEILQVSPLDEMDVKLGLFGLLATGLLAAEGFALPGGSGDIVEETEAGPEDHPSPVDNAETARMASIPVPPQAEPADAAQEVDPTPPGTATASGHPEIPRKPGPPPSPPASRPEPAATAPPAAPSPPPPAGASKSILDLDAFLARTEGERTAAPQAAPPGAGAVPAAREQRSASEPELEKERAEVLKWIGSRTGGDYYGILGVERGADEESVRRAYYRVAKRFHPDRFRRPGFEGLLQDVERMFAATTEAYNTLSDDRARSEYEREMSSRSKGGKGSEGDPASLARDSYLRARKHVEAEEYFDAATLLETACRMDGGHAEYWMLLGTVQAKNPKWRKKAEESFMKAIELSPASADAYLHLARLYKQGGLTKRTQDMYRKVLEWDPANEEALAVTSGKEAGQDAGVGGKLRSIFKGSRS